MGSRHSAALLAYDVDASGALAVFLAHMGGPYWAARDEGAWSIPKGEYDPGREAAGDAARREFAEEIGRDAPDGPMLDLGVLVQPSGKRVHAYAVRAHASLRFVASNTFPMEWPRGSGRYRQVPEVDRAGWFDLPAARRKLLAGQIGFLDALVTALAARGEVVREPS